MAALDELKKKLDEALDEQKENAKLNERLEREIKTRDAQLTQIEDAVSKAEDRLKNLEKTISEKNAKILAGIEQDKREASEHKKAIKEELAKVEAEKNVLHSSNQAAQNLKEKSSKIIEEYNAKTDQLRKLIKEIEKVI